MFTTCQKFSAIVWIRAAVPMINLELVEASDFPLISMPLLQEGWAAGAEAQPARRRRTIGTGNTDASLHPLFQFPVAPFTLQANLD